jgi:hypothetical protein
MLENVSVRAYLEQPQKVQIVGVMPTTSSSTKHRVGSARGYEPSGQLLSFVMVLSKSPARVQNVGKCRKMSV